ncbi:hypothetical protein [Nocardioides sp.]|uniref:hypothetical protein n=1 Tax=Nocardioides sp. TaxID=35761 RepID=UPI0035614F3E
MRVEPPEPMAAAVVAPVAVAAAVTTPAPIAAAVVTPAPVRASATPLGLPGRVGLSAYQVAVANGFEGTEVEWLDSLAASAPAEVFVDGSPAALNFSPNGDGTYSLEVTL